MRVWLLVVALVVLPQLAHAEPVFVSEQAAGKLVAGGALVLDARKTGYSDDHIAGAVPIDWRAYRDGIGRTGRVSDDDADLARRLGALGIDDHRAVLVYGDAQAGFGEEGRIAWMLRYLGHKNVHILDGGYAAWHGKRDRVAPHTEPGIFTIQRKPSLRVGTSEVADAVRNHRATIIDTRTPEEWNGARKYFESRGGHLPGARFIDYASLFDKNGHVVHALDIPRDEPVYLYCTGGVRSGEAAMLLQDLGYDAKNYDAGMWGYSETTLPLEKSTPPTN